GVTDARVLKQHFGRWNIWYCSGTAPQPSVYHADPLDEPRILYVNSSTLVTGQNNDSPPGHAAGTCFAPCGYQAWEKADPPTKRALRDKHTSLLLDVIERRFAPGLRQNLGVVHLQTPEDKERDLGAPRGNIYGRRFSPRDVWTKVPFQGILPNLYF